MEMERKINKKKPKIVISTKIEALVEPFFLEEFFLIKIQIVNYLKPPFLIVSAGKWVRVDNIRFARQHKVFCDVLGIPKVPWSTLDLFSK